MEDVIRKYLCNSCLGKKEECMKYKEEHHEIKKYEHKQETPHYKEPKTESFMFADDYMDEHFKRLREDKLKGKN